MVDLILEDTNEMMDKSVTHTRDEFVGIRTGRATTALVENILVNYHGASVPLQQLAGLSVPEAQSLVISPYDLTALEAIEKAISEADLGLTPNSDGNVIRLVFPPLTEERRRELVKIVSSMAEEGKVAVRNNRRTARNELVKMNKDGDISEDDLQRAEKKLDDLTHNKEAQINEALAAKEKELLTT